VVLPHRLGLHSTTPGCAAKPHSRAPDQGLDDDPRDGDKSKRLHNHERTADGGEAAAAYTVPSRKMRRIVAIFLQDDGEPSREDERDTDTNHGDLVPLETCSLCVGL
jgi:hypothetical protein